LHSSGSSTTYRTTGSKTLLRSLIRHVRKLSSGTSQKRVGHGIGSTHKLLPLRFLLTRRQSAARCAERSLKPILSWRAALSSVIRTAKPQRCVGVEKHSEKQDVYCLEVPTIRAFLIEGGITVHNCSDAVRYLCMARPWVEDEEKAEVISAHPGQYKDILSSHLTRQRSSWR
jgi:hypothetical protein